EPGASPCEGLTMSDPVEMRAHPPLTEVSGATRSTRSPDAIWVHEDSGRAAVLTEIAFDGDQLSRWEVPDVEMIDWEDLAAVADADGRRHLIVGDIGDNLAQRDHVRLIRVPEPRPGDSGDLAEVPAVVRLTLPEGPSNAEALLVDPVTADAVVVTKSVLGVAEVLVGPRAAMAPDGAEITMERAGALRLGPGQAVLAGDVSPAGTLVGLRTPGRVLLWTHEESRSLAETLLETDPCRAPTVIDILGEAFAFLGEDRYLLAGEGDAAELIRVG
ncbi:MAG: hypothetical protein ACLFWR_14210, partial [Acidimicrobiales bacterium]